MNSTRYKTLLSYLPGMASVVNSFQSEQVQLAVFDRLMSALEEKTDVMEGTSPSPSSPVTSRRTAKSSSGSSLISGGEVAHDLVEGESIHADLDVEL